MPAPYDPVPVLNVSGEDIPSHAVVEPTGAITDGAFEVTLPTRSGNRAVLVNGPGVIPDGKAGQAYGHPRVVVASDDEPEQVGEEWGAQAGSWELAAGTAGGFVYLGGYAGGRGNWLRVGDGTGNGVESSLTTSTLLPCPVPIAADCCILYPECGTVYDCNGAPIDRTAVDFAVDCLDGIEGVSVTIPTNCGDRVVHCGNTVGACEPRCDFPATDDVYDPGAPGTCCEPTVGSVMESSPHAGECGFFPPCLTVTGGNGTGSLTGITFDTTATVNYDAEWPFRYVAPGGNFYIIGRFVLCLDSPFPGWYFAGRVYVYNPAGAGGSGSEDDACGCDTTFGACPTAADDASQEIIAFHLGDKTETLQLTTACGTIDLTIEPCETPVDDVYYGCESSSAGTFCVEMVGGPFLNDPTCGGACAELDPDPPVEDTPCCDGPGEVLETPGSVVLTVTVPDGPNATSTPVNSAGVAVWTGVSLAGPITVSCIEGAPGSDWSLTYDSGSASAAASAVSCAPFGLVFSDAAMKAFFGCTGDITVTLA